jgi:hypothetical protein
MLIVDILSKSNVFQIAQTINPMDKTSDTNESSSLQLSELMIDDMSNSISTITIPLKSSQPILAVSSNSILVNEYTKKRNQLIVIDDNLNKFSIHSPITEPIIDVIWYEIKKRFFLLTENKIFTFNPNEKIIERIFDIKSNDKIPFKSFTVINNQNSLLIAYDEWESKFIDQWQQDNENSVWKLIKKHPLNLTSNEFIGNILAINEDNCSKLGITIFNDLNGEWRMELRDAEMLICFQKILLSRSDQIYDYRMIEMKNIISDIKWLVYSQANKEIIAIDSKWKKKHLNYKFPVYRMAQFKKNNLIIRLKNRIDIHLCI